MLQKNRPQSIESIVLESAAGLRVSLVNLGATIQSILVPTPDGHVEAVLGYECIDDYQSDSNFMGATVGRFANRIRDARFSQDGVAYRLDPNEASTGHCLHGGGLGLHKQFWTLTRAKSGAAAECCYVSSESECGFPGELKINIRYQLVSGHVLVIDYRATTDKDTIVSIANHAYFNLDQNKNTIDTHQVSINASRYTPMDDTRVPTGEVRNVHESIFDLRRPKPLRSGDISYPFDDNFVLPESAGQLRKAATLYSPDSGIGLRLLTTQPALQLYTGEHLARPFHSRQGLCLETQAFPNAPNQPGFPSARLAPGDTYLQRTVYEFCSGNPYL